MTTTCKKNSRGNDACPCASRMCQTEVKVAAAVGGGEVEADADGLTGGVSGRDQIPKGRAGIGSVRWHSGFYLGLVVLRLASLCRLWNFSHL